MTQNRRPVRPGASANRAGSARQRPVRAANAAAPRRRLPYDFWPLTLACAALIAVCLAVQSFIPETGSGGENPQAVAAVAEIHGDGPIRINELMSSNSGTIADENGVTADWIEVANVSGGAVNLEGYILAKDENASKVFVFPEHWLEAGECAIVFADNLYRTEGEYHAPMKLSSQGGTLMLFSPSRTAIDSVNFPAMGEDRTYARESAGEWRISDQPTPGLPNTEDSYRALRTPAVDAGVEIAEIVSSNPQFAPDKNGAYHDYIELHNTTAEAIDLSGWFLSDDDGKILKWRLPEGMILEAGGCRIVYASGLDRADADEPHANFGLSSEGETVILADRGGKIVDRVEFGLLKNNQAWQKQADGSWSAGTPSPNQVNG